MAFQTFQARPQKFEPSMAFVHIRIPWSWMARRIYRQFVYGLSRIGNMRVFTSSGAGTWGPPLRLGSNPEIVVLEFE